MPPSFEFAQRVLARLHHIASEGGLHGQVDTDYGGTFNRDAYIIIELAQAIDRWDPRDTLYFWYVRRCFYKVHGVKIRWAGRNGLAFYDPNYKEEG